MIKTGPRVGWEKKWEWTYVLGEEAEAWVLYLKDSIKPGNAGSNQGRNVQKSPKERNLAKPRRGNQEKDAEVGKEMGEIKEPGFASITHL